MPNPAELDFDCLVAEWMKTDPDHPLYRNPLYESSASSPPGTEILTQEDYPVGMCWCLKCMKEHDFPCPPETPPFRPPNFNQIWDESQNRWLVLEDVQRPLASVPLSSPSITTPLKTLQDSPFPLQKSATSAFSERSPLPQEPVISKDTLIPTLLDPSPLGKRSLEEGLTLKEPEVLQSSAELTAPKKKRVKKARSPLVGELSRDKVLNEMYNKRINSDFGVLTIIDCIGIVPGHLMTYECIDRDMNTIIVERFRFECTGIECDLNINAQYQM